MYSVTQRIKQIKQPRGGFVKLSQFNCIQLNDDILLNDKENIHPSLVGLVVDYMSRFLYSDNLLESFKISVLGAIVANEISQIESYLYKITGLDDTSIFYACKTVGYDVCFRAGLQHFNGTEHINPNKETIDNIRILIQRSLFFFENFGPIIEDGFVFDSAYTDIISSGDGDFLTKDTLFDFKVSKNKPSAQNILQILVYYLMGKRSKNLNFKNIDKIGIFNPRLNNIYVIEIENIDKIILEVIEKDVIGYREDKF